MKFGKYIEGQKASLPEPWRDHFLDYKGLKDGIKSIVREEAASGAAGVAFSPRETSLSVNRVRSERDVAEESFFEHLEAEVAKVGAFTAQLVQEIDSEVSELQERAADADPGQAQGLRAEAKQIGEKFLALEKYVNLNYLGFHKAVKKHDKQLPLAPCQQFYMHVLRNQPWVQGDHSHLLERLSTVYSQLRGPARGGSSDEDGIPGITLRGLAARRSLDSLASDVYGSGYGPSGRVTRRYWVRTTDVSAVKHHLLQYLPVAPAGTDQRPEPAFVNSVYLDNASLELYHGLLDKRPGATTVRIRWYGTEVGGTVALERRAHSTGNDADATVLELPERFVVPFLSGNLTEKDFVKNLRSIQEMNGVQDEAEVRRTAQLFGDLLRMVSAKQLAPMLRTQAMRSAYGDDQDGGSSGIRMTLDTNVVMLRENPYSAVVSDRWARDLSHQVPRTEVTRFPHAVLDIELDQHALHNPPSWLQELYGSGYLTEVHAFSKMLHGVATLLSDALQAVPYWVDDESVRASMAASGPSPARSVEGTIMPAARLGGVLPRAAPSALDQLSHPLLGDEPTLQLMPDRTDVAGFSGGPVEEAPTGLLAWWFLSRDRERKLDSLDLPLLGIGAHKQGPPPKNVFALERTYLAWIHMAITVGAIAAAMVGVSGGGRNSEQGLARLTDVVAMIMMVMAAAIAGYALLLYLQRERQLSHQVDEDAFVVDSRGTNAIVVIIVVSLGAIFLLSLVDFIMCL